ncbi:MAG: BrnT family toxin [bacterium]
MTESITAPEFEGFDWSGGNVEKNWDLHHVSPLEAEQVFFNSPLLTGADDAHSQSEKRFFALGQTDEGRELFIAFTIRGKRLRVVSARDMSRKERRVYRT